MTYTLREDQVQTCQHCHSTNITHDETTGAYCQDCGCVTEAPISWLAQWSHSDRGSLSQIFRRGFRTGYTTPHALATHIRHRIMFEGKYRGTEILASFEGQWESVCRYAAKVIHDEQRPVAEREQAKTERSKFYAMSGKPVTKAQLAMLRGRGYRGSAPKDRLEASKIIDEILKGNAEKIEKFLSKKKASVGAEASTPSPQV